MNDELSMQRLESDLIYSIRQFQQYAEMLPLARNTYIVCLLEDLLNEAKKMQLSESQLNDLQ